VSLVGCLRLQILFTFVYLLRTIVRASRAQRVAVEVPATTDFSQYDSQISNLGLSEQMIVVVVVDKESSVVIVAITLRAERSNYWLMG
jgi:hypothetical protein